MILNIRITAARLVALLVLAAMLGAGAQAAVAAEQTLTMGIGDYANIGLDPTLSSKLWPETGGWQEQHYFTHYSPLIELDGDTNIIPWMAESYEVSDDLRTMTFHLRKGVKFADGTPLNASILKYNFDRIITYGWADKLIPAIPVFFNYDYAEALDEYTLKIHFKKGWLSLPFEFAGQRFFGNFISPLDVEPAWDLKGILKTDKKFNGLGAYNVDEHESIPKEKIVLIRRPSWRDDLDFHKPKLDKIVLTNIADSQTSAMALEKGEIDYINRYWSPPLESLPKLEKNPEITIATRPDTRIYYIATSWWKEPFNGSDGMLLRKAICYALDRNEMVNGAFLGYAIPATDTIFLSPLWPEFPECCRKGFEYDPEKAKALLAEAGWKDIDGDGILDKNGKSLKDLDLLITSSTTTLVWMKDLALILQSQLKKVGIDVKIRTLEYGDYSQSRSSGDFDLLFSYTNPRTYPMAKQFATFSTTTSTWTYSVYDRPNGTMGTIVQEAQNALSPNERDNYLCQACDILYEDAGIIPMVYNMDYAVMNSRIKGFQFGAGWGDYDDHIEECWIED